MSAAPSENRDSSPSLADAAGARDPILRALDDAAPPAGFDEAGAADAPAPPENGEGSPARPEAAGASGGAASGGGDDGGLFLGDERDDAIDAMNEEWAFVLVGSRAVVIRERRDGPIEDRTRVVGLDAFRAFYANRSVRYLGWDAERVERVVKHVKIAPLWLNSPRRRTCLGVEFHPDPGDAPGTPDYFNLWRGFAVAPSREAAAARAPRYSVFRDHLLTNICGGDAGVFRWLWHWFAHLIQRPRERIGTAVVMRGRMGVGKTVAGEVIGSLFPAHYFLVDDPRYLTGQFNAHMSSCILLQVDEGFWAGDKAAEGRLKGLVTGKAQMIEAKGVDPIRLANYVRLLFSSNEGWVVPAGLDERRFAVLDVGDLAKENHGYFRELFAQIEAGGREALLADLLAVDLDAPDAPNLRVIPKTEALLDQKIQSLDHVTSWLFERLVAGAQTRRGEQWRDVVPIDTLFDDYIRSSEKVGVRRRAEITVFGMTLRKLLPSLGVRRRTESFEVEPGVATSRRVNCYVFPPLADCRAAFERAVGQTIDWTRYGGLSDAEMEREREREGERDDEF